MYRSRSRSRFLHDDSYLQRHNYENDYMYRSTGSLFRSQIEITTNFLEAEKKRLLLIKNDIRNQIQRHTGNKAGSYESDDQSSCSFDSPNSSGAKSFIERPYDDSLTVWSYPYQTIVTQPKKAVSKSQPSLIVERRRKTTDKTSMIPRFTNDMSTPNLSVEQRRNGHIVGTTKPLSDNNNTSESEEKPRKKLPLDLVCNDDGTILAGSLKSLVKHLIPGRDRYPEKSFVFAFLLNSRLFIAPSDLLREILQFVIFEQDAETERFKKDSVSRFFRNIVNLLSEWSDYFPYDFRDQSMIEQLNEILELCSSADGALRKHTVLLLTKLFNKLSKVDRYETALTNLKNEETFEVLPGLVLNGILETCDNPLNIARQLTHIELERLSMIGPEEFVCTFAHEFSREKIESGEKSYSSMRNIQHYADWFNRLSFLVATEVTKHLKKKHRVKMVEFFIDVAKECFNIGNFNSLMSIVAGLNMSQISRLKKTWAKVEKSKLAILEHQLDPTGNFLSYRATLKAAVWRSEGAHQDCEKIIVPFFSLLVKDLLMLHDGCVKKLPNGHINMSKFAQFAGQMQEFMSWKQIECPFDRDQTLLHYLLTSPIFNEATLQLASFECEMPDNSSDKELHKQLRWKMAGRGIVRLSTSNSILFLCDLQEKFRPSVKFFPQIVSVAKRLVDAAKILQVPMLATEQYPKGLGRTVPELELSSANVPVFEKLSFSMCCEPVIKQLQDKHPAVSSVLLCGIEAHACVYQTTLDLLEKNFSVHLVVDAISSRSNVDRFFALRQLEKAGATLTTSECALLSLLKGADHPKFREVQKLIMSVAPDSDLLHF